MASAARAWIASGVGFIFACVVQYPGQVARPQVGRYSVGWQRVWCSLACWWLSPAASALEPRVEHSYSHRRELEKVVADLVVSSLIPIAEYLQWPRRAVECDYTDLPRDLTRFHARRPGTPGRVQTGSHSCHSRGRSAQPRFYTQVLSKDTAGKLPLVGKSHHDMGMQAARSGAVKTFLSLQQLARGAQIARI